MFYFGRIVSNFIVFENSISRSKFKFYVNRCAFTTFQTNRCVLKVK